MSASRDARAPCPVCGQERAERELLHGDVVHGPVADLVRRQHPEWTTDRRIRLPCLNRYRADHVELMEELVASGRRVPPGSKPPG